MSLSGKPCVTKTGLTPSHLSPAAFAVVVATASVATATIHRLVVILVISPAATSSLLHPPAPFPCARKRNGRAGEETGRDRERRRKAERGNRTATISALLLAATTTTTTTTRCRCRRRDGREDTDAARAFARARIISPRDRVAWSDRRILLVAPNRRRADRIAGHTPGMTPTSPSARDALTVTWSEMCAEVRRRMARLRWTR